MKKIGVILTTLALTICFIVPVSASPSETKQANVYPRFDIKGTLILKVPDLTHNNGYEVLNYQIIEENEDLTSLTCIPLVDIDGKNNEKTEIFLKDAKVILYSHGTSTTDPIKKRVYTDYSAYITLDEQIAGKEPLAQPKANKKGANKNDK